MSKYSWWRYLLQDLKTCARYPPVMCHDENRRKTREEYVAELEPLKNAHPLTPSEDIEKGCYTHTLITGGKFYLNDESVPGHILFPKALSDVHRSLREAAPRLLGRRETYDDLFWVCLAYIISNKKSWDVDACLTEAVSKPYHRFYVDLDLLFKDKHELSAWHDFLKRMCYAVGQAILTCFPDIAANGDPSGNFEFTVLTTKGYREKTLENGQRVYKRGIHLVWQGLIVDKGRSETLVKAIDESLTRDVRRDLQAGENSWKKALDLSVYNSGLRPCGSPKSTPCDKCRPFAKKKFVATKDEVDDRANYYYCHPDPPSGFISQGEESVYALEYICRGDGVLLTKKTLRERIESHILKDPETDKTFDFSLKRLTSIRTSATEMTPGFDPPSHLRAPISLENAGYRVHPRRDPLTGDYLPEPKRRKLPFKGNSFELFVSKESVQFLTRIIQNFSGFYKNIIVDKVWAFPTEDARKMLPAPKNEPQKRTLYLHMWIHVKGEGSHYCHLKPGEHGSNQIRFVIGYDGSIAQGCWSSKMCKLGKPCCRSWTKGMNEFGVVDKVTPADYPFLINLFTTKN